MTLHIERNTKSLLKTRASSEAQSHDFRSVRDFLSSGGFCCYLISTEALVCILCCTLSVPSRLIWSLPCDPVILSCWYVTESCSISLRRTVSPGNGWGLCQVPATLQQCPASPGSDMETSVTALCMSFVWAFCDSTGNVTSKECTSLGSWCGINPGI